MKISEKERVTIHKRLWLAFLRDQTENPNTYEIDHGHVHCESRAQQYENEEAWLMELTNPDGTTANIFPEFE